MLFLVLMAEYCVSVVTQPRHALQLGSEGAEHSHGLLLSYYCRSVATVGLESWMPQETKFFTVATTELNVTLKTYCQVLTSGS